MKPQISIVMYHYVRDVEKTGFPRIHARSRQEFERQLDHIADQYTVIPIRDYADYLLGKATELPARACILTFDDGFKEHADYVLPSLLHRKMAGAFYPITEPLSEHRVATVHKVQFLLAQLGSGRLSDELEKSLNVLAFANAFAQAAGPAKKLPYRYDDSLTSTLKNRIAALPSETRHDVIDDLFRTHITSDERAFAESLYLSDNDLRQLQHAGMDIGGHTHTHPRLTLLPASGQTFEVQHSQQILGAILGSAPKTFAYPYGDHNEDIIALLKEQGVTLALSTLVGCESDHNDVYRIKRLNTNDLPH